MNFNDRAYAFPECHSVPKAKFMPDSDAKDGGSKRKAHRRIDNPVFKNVRNWDHTSSLGALIHTTEAFFRPEVWHDRQLLARIFYRNWNQHKNAVYFRRLYELRRALKVLEKVQLREMIERTVKAFYDPNTSKHARKPAAWQALPCQHYMTALAGRVSSVARLVGKLIEICQNVYIQFTAQMSQTLFMPLAMVIQGISARLFMLFGIWHQDLVTLYTSLLEWLPHLPACPDSLSGKTNLLVPKLPHPSDLALLPSPLADTQLAAEISQAAKATPESDIAATAASDTAELDAGSPVLGKRPSDELDAGRKPKSKKRLKRHILDLYDDDDLGGVVEQGL
ncbi:hypothetical protein GQ54DRAFT_295336 [Martensiomyces pterosporus]|nr:hypothetical protein GQ54DRAFT_295336 [Martensiomyces pterosporus]